MVSTQKLFIDKLVPGAIESMKKYGICASVIIAQAILESGWGESSLSKQAFNLFGVKAIGNWRGSNVTMRTAEYDKNNNKYFIDANFRKYSNFVDSIEDHALFLVNNPTYKEHGFFSSLDYKKQTAALQNAGYATSPTYAKMLNELIEQYKLYEYDKEVKTMKVNYILEFQRWYNATTKTTTPLTEDGVCGPNTLKAYEIVGKLLRGEY